MIDRDALRVWLEQSCAVQGVPVVVSDSSAIARVGVLLRGRDAAEKPPLGASAAPHQSQSPSRNDPTRVETDLPSGLARLDSGEVQNGGDNRRLP